MPLQEFFQWMKKFIMRSDMSKGNVDRKRGIKEANKFFCIRANVNFSSSLKSKRNLLFPTEFHAKMLVFSKRHKIVNNCKQLFVKRKLLQGQDRIFTFFCKLSQTDRSCKSTNFMNKRNKLLSFSTNVGFDEIFDQNSTFRWHFLTDSGVLEEIFVKNV